MADERCWLCAFWDGERCTQTYRLVIHVTPENGIGGQVEFTTTPGMVPEELQPKLTEYIYKFCEKVLPAISMMPVWEEIREYQLANLPERADCPARVESKHKRAFLKVVKSGPH
jgi:hypothetical protein